MWWRKVVCACTYGLIIFPPSENCHAGMPQWTISTWWSYILHPIRNTVPALLNCIMEISNLSLALVHVNMNICHLCSNSSTHLNVPLTIESFLMSTNINPFFKGHYQIQLMNHSHFSDWMVYAFYLVSSFSWLTDQSNGPYRRWYTWTAWANVMQGIIKHFQRQK